MSKDQLPTGPLGDDPDQLPTRAAATAQVPAVAAPDRALLLAAAR